MKFGDILKSAGSNLMRNKARTILTIVAIFIGAFTISLVGGLNVGVNTYINEVIDGSGGENILFIMPEGLMSMSNEPTEYSLEQAGSIAGVSMEEIENLDGIISVKPIYLSLTVDYIVGESNNKYELPRAGGKIGDTTIQLASGEQLNQTTDAFELLLTPEFVEVLGFSSYEDAVGNTVTLGVTSSATGEQQTVDATIAGVREASLVQNGETLLNTALEEEIVRINEYGLPEDMQGEIFGVSALTDPTLTEEQFDTLRTELVDMGLLSQTLEENAGMLVGIANAITGVLVMFGAISLLAASFGIINTLYMSVQERTREIGLMKAMGLSSSKVFRIFSWEATLIGFFGSVLGVLGAMGVGALINNLAADLFLMGIPPFTLIRFSALIIAAVILIIMLIAFLAGTLPARRAAKLDPIEALRHE